MTLSVREAAQRAGRDPQTIRRWIRSGRLRARKVGTQRVIESEDLERLLTTDTLPVPDGWTRKVTGEPMPDTVGAIRRGRVGH
jgi:excisionase family DNA binding protein